MSIAQNTWNSLTKSDRLKILSVENVGYETLDSEYGVTPEDKINEYSESDFDTLPKTMQGVVADELEEEFVDNKYHCPKCNLGFYFKEDMEDHNELELSKENIGWADKILADEKLYNQTYIDEITKDAEPDDSNSTTVQRGYIDDPNSGFYNTVHFRRGRSSDRKAIEAVQDDWDKANDEQRRVSLIYVGEDPGYSSTHYNSLPHRIKKAITADSLKQWEKNDDQELWSVRLGTNNTATENRTVGLGKNSTKQDVIDYIKSTESDGIKIFSIDRMADSNITPEYKIPAAESINSEDTIEWPNYEPQTVGEYITESKLNGTPDLQIVSSLESRNISHDDATEAVHEVLVSDKDRVAYTLFRKRANELGERELAEIEICGVI